MNTECVTVAVRWLVRYGGIALVGTSLVAGGCRSSRGRPGLLGPRAVIPDPYAAPAAPGAGMLSAEPSLPPEIPAVMPPILPPSVPFDEGVLPPALAPVPIDEGRFAEGIVLPPTVDSQRLSYTVRKGDSLWLIAESHGVTVAELAAENNLDPNKTIHPGDVLVLPPGARKVDPSEIRRPKPPAAAGKQPASKPAAKSTGPKSIAKEPIPANGVYTVKSGDNLWVLSRRFGVQSQDVIRWNDLKTDVLQVGQKLRLRGDAAAAGGTATAPERATPPAAGAGVMLPPADGTTPGPRTEVEEEAAVGVPTTPNVLPPMKPGALEVPRMLSHTVTEGETLQIIADMYGTTVEAIRRENPTVKNDADLKPNMKLMVPYR
ncbi:MAG: LysM peptidoglycan-binding domain-containing protein [Lentisphaeria bacterium]|nr:LysM peptidoglycan-binding domain-containing protein [Lentisphaeria bacterium]